MKLDCHDQKIDLDKKKKSRIQNGIKYGIYFNVK